MNPPAGPEAAGAPTLFDRVSRSIAWNALLLPLITVLNALTSILVRRGFGLHSAAYDIVLGLSNTLLFYTSLGIPTSLSKFLPEREAAGGRAAAGRSPCSPAPCWKSDAPPVRLLAVVEDPLTPDQVAWLQRDERLWRKAAAIVGKRPGLDLEGVYHALRNLERPPAERLRRALSFAGLRPQRA